MRLDCYQFVAPIRPKQLLVMHLGTIGFLTLLSNAFLQPNLRPLRVHSFVAHSSHTRKRAATSPDKRVHSHTHTYIRELITCCRRVFRCRTATGNKKFQTERTHSGSLLMLWLTELRAVARTWICIACDCSQLVTHTYREPLKRVRARLSVERIT